MNEQINMMEDELNKLLARKRRNSVLLEKSVTQHQVSEWKDWRTKPPRKLYKTNLNSSVPNLKKSFPNEHDINVAKDRTTDIKTEIDKEFKLKKSKETVYKPYLVSNKKVKN